MLARVGTQFSRNLPHSGGAQALATSSVALPRHPTPRQQRRRRRRRRRCAPAAAAAAWPLVVEAALAAPPMCFDVACQAAKDRAFVGAIAAPVLALGALLALVLRPPPAGDAANVFEAEDTGTVFEAPGGANPERDRFGKLAYKAVGYTPWPVEEGAPGERLRVAVGPVGAPRLTTFVFAPTLPPPSAIVAVALPRPLGVVFAEEPGRGGPATRRAVVAELVPGSAAERLAKTAALGGGGPAAAAAALPGDVLRAVTATTLVYENALVSVRPPVRTTVLYGADGARWPEVAAALKRGLAEDGDVTLVLERRLPPEGPS